MNENNNRDADTASDLEQDTGNATFPKDEATPLSSPCSINFHSVRARLADIDGLSGKAVLDGIVQAGILADDKTKFVKEVSHTQSKGKPETTTITIEWI